MGVTYDSGALIAAERNERRMWARHRAFLTSRVVPTVPAGVVAQTWKGGSRQAMLSRLLVGCDIEPLDNDQARRVGPLATKAATTDIVDASVVEGALRRVDLVISSDREDLRSIAAAAGGSLQIEEP
jgi:hypothetical protein